MLGVQMVLLGSSRVCKGEKKSGTPNKKSMLWGFVTINLSERVKVSPWSRGVSETVIADGYLPFLTY